MPSLKIFTMTASALLFLGCATTAPVELVNARDAYRQASTGPAATIAPAELHVAHVALLSAERAFNDEPKSYLSRDLAYVALRKSQIAMVTASIAIDEKKENKAQKDIAATQGKVAAKNQRELKQTRNELAASEQEGAIANERLAAEQVARADAEQRATDAQGALSDMAAVKLESRGVVITLSGSVLFASNKSEMLPEARVRLGRVADVLLTNRDRNLTIEGHTDSQGTDHYNQDLSQHRADAVRDFLVSRSYQTDRIRSNGMGETRPVADNATAEGRANNRRVEIIIDRDIHTSNP
jgi:outer membrane protein OmpA-like peptidoglycan-associated protein